MGDALRTSRKIGSSRDFSRRFHGDVIRSMKISFRAVAAVVACLGITSAALAQSAGTVTNHAFPIGKGAGQTGFTPLLCGAGTLPIGQAGANPICQSISGDITISAAGVAAIGATVVHSSMLNADVFSTARSWSGAQTFANPVLTGTPTAPTAAVDTNTTQLATTAFTLGQAASATPLIDGAAAVGSSTRFARADHVHPTDTTRAPLASPAFTGTPTAPTAPGGTNTAQIATTQYVQSAVVAATTGVASVGGQTGAISVGPDLQMVGSTIQASQSLYR